MTKGERIMAGLDRDSERLTCSDLAAEWGISRQAVSKLFKKVGAPAFGADRRMRRDVAERYYLSCNGTRAMMRRRASEAISDAANASGIADLPAIEVSRQRAEALKVEALQMEVDTQRGRLVRRDDVADAAAADGTMIRAMVMSIPGLVATRCVELTDANDIRTYIDGVVRDVLTQLAGTVTPINCTMWSPALEPLAGCARHVARLCDESGISHDVRDAILEAIARCAVEIGGCDEGV